MKIRCLLTHDLAGGRDITGQVSKTVPGTQLDNSYLLSQMFSLKTNKTRQFVIPWLKTP